MFSILQQADTSSQDWAHRLEMKVTGLQHLLSCHSNINYCPDGSCLLLTVMSLISWARFEVAFLRGLLDCTQVKQPIFWLSTAPMTIVSKDQIIKDIYLPKGADTHLSIPIPLKMDLSASRWGNFLLLSPIFGWKVSAWIWFYFHCASYSGKLFVKEDGLATCPERGQTVIYTLLLAVHSTIESPHYVLLQTDQIQMRLEVDKWEYLAPVSFGEFMPFERPPSLMF